MSTNREVSHASCILATGNQPHSASSETLATADQRTWLPQRTFALFSLLLLLTEYLTEQLKEGRISSASCFRDLGLLMTAAVGSWGFSYLCTRTEAERKAGFGYTLKGPPPVIHLLCQSLQPPQRAAPAEWQVLKHTSLWATL